jgi:hypothetical protein
MSVLAKNDAEIFLRAFSFVQDESRFLQNGFMREPPLDDDNLPIERACSLGWLMYCGADYQGRMRQIFDKEAVLAGEDGGMTEFSDTRSHAEVIALWRRVGIKYGWLSNELEQAA